MLMAVREAHILSTITTSSQTPTRPVRQRQRSERPGSRTILNQRYVLERTCEISNRVLYYRPPEKIHGLPQPNWTPFIDQGRRYLGGNSLDRTLDNGIGIGLRARMVD